MNRKPNRLTVVDALRGFSIVAIMLLHNIEHFDFYFVPENIPEWLQAIDKIVWDSLFFLFGGKVYAIFALLFGLTFFIQSDNQEKKGNDFRGRFAWRLLLLLAFGFINSAFYEGDILSIYAVIGIFLIPVAKLNNKLLLGIAVFLMFQPVLWIQFIKALQTPDMPVANPKSWTYFGRMSEYITGDSLLNTWVGNLTNGKKAVLLWSWEKGRVFQTLSLFIFGMLAGRKSLFDVTQKNKQFWKKSLIISIISFIVLFFINKNMAEWIDSAAIRRPLSSIEESWMNMSFMMLLVSGFVLLFQTRFFYKALNTLSPLGRMSLSNYIMQSVIGTFIYHGWGLAMYQYTNFTFCLLIGIVLAILQGLFSNWWLKSHKRGPLEHLWHKATWVKFV